MVLWLEKNLPIVNKTLSSEDSTNLASFFNNLFCNLYIIMSSKDINGVRRAGGEKLPSRSTLYRISQWWWRSAVLKEATGDSVGVGYQDY